MATRKNDPAPEKTANKAIQEPDAAPRAEKPEETVFSADPKTSTAVICGNDVLFLGTGVKEIRIIRSE